MPAADLQPVTRIELIDMPSDPLPIPAGSRGTVVEVTEFDDWAQVWVEWDDPRSLALVVPPDSYRVIG